jgi:hypothetical protein
MRLLMSVAAVAAVLVGLGLPTVAGGQTPTADSVIGTLTFPSPFAGPLRETYEVASEPSGENARGEVVVEFLNFPGTVLHFEVTCLSVTGNRAVIGMFRPDPIIGDTSIYRLVVDGGPGGTDTVGVENGVGRPLECATIPIAVDPSLPVSGDATVTDAKPLPTIKSQCRNGNWRTFGVFKNQGDCFSFVATKGKNPPTNSP